MPEIERAYEAMPPDDETQRAILEATVAAARGGSEPAFLQLIDMHRPLIWSIAWRATRNTEDVLDVTQEIILRLWRTIGKFRGDSSFASWTRTIAVRESLRWISVHGSRACVLPLETIEVIDTAALGSAGNELTEPATANRQIETQDQRKMLEQAMLNLPERQRMALSLRFYDELAVREIGEAMGCSEGAVKQHLFRAMKHMRRLLRRKG